MKNYCDILEQILDGIVSHDGEKELILFKSYLYLLLNEIFCEDNLNEAKEILNKMKEHLKSNFSTFRACNSHMATLLVSTGLHPARLSLSVGRCHLPSRPCDYAQGTWPGSSEYSCSAWTSQQVSFSDQALYYSLCLACQAALSPYRLSDLPGPNLALSPCLGVD